MGIVGKYEIMPVIEILNKSIWIGCSEQVQLTPNSSVALSQTGVVDSCMCAPASHHKPPSSKPDCFNLCIHICIMYQQVCTYICAFSHRCKWIISIQRTIVTPHSFTLDEPGENDSSFFPFCPFPWCVWPLSISASSYGSKSPLSCWDLRNC